MPRSLRRIAGLKNHRTLPRVIARTVHLSVVERLVGMLHRVGFEESVVFNGGVAKNKAVVQLLRDKLEIAVLVPDKPDIVGALGAALYAG